MLKCKNVFLIFINRYVISMSVDTFSFLFVQNGILIEHCNNFLLQVKNLHVKKVKLHPLQKKVSDITKSNVFDKFHSIIFKNLLDTHTL